MTKGIILRVPAGTVISSELSASLNKILPNFKLEEFQNQPSYKESIRNRINSLHDAFSYLLEAYPLDPKFTALEKATLQNFANSCKEKCTLISAKPEDLNKELEQYTANLVAIISEAWHWPNNKISDAIACLNEAEQYMLMVRGRPTLATLTPMQIERKAGGKIDYVLQVDEPIAPHYKQWIEELTKIKALGFPKKSEWFRKLPDYQKAYFSNLNPEQLNLNSEIKEISALQQVWEKTKRVDKQATLGLQRIAKGDQPYPSWFDELKPALKAMVRVLSDDPSNFESLLETFKAKLTKEGIPAAFNDDIVNMTQTPSWYSVLSNTQHYFLEHALKNAAKIEDAVSFLTSRHRTLPAPANFASHSLYKYQDGEFSSLYGKRYRSSHIASREALNWSKEIQQRFSDANFTKVTELAVDGQPILFQTLISALFGSDILPEAVTKHLPPDLPLYNMARGTVERSANAKNIYQHNHPLNIAKYVFPTEKNDRDSGALIKLTESRLPNPALETLLTLYKNALGSPPGTGTVYDKVGRELFLSSYEQLLMLTMKGYSYGSCVSGKDRKAIELIHTDAMMIYYERYNEWPHLDAPLKSRNRQHFVSIIVDLYCSRHQHVHAGQNAPGSEGLKHPSVYLAGDTAKAIKTRLGNQDALTLDDNLASFNEVKYIYDKEKDEMISGEDLLCSLMALQLGDANCSRMYMALYKLINEKDLFEVKSSTFSLSMFKKDSGSYIPTGISEIQRIMRDSKAGESNIARMGLIFKAVLNRRESDPTRTEATNCIYGRIRELFKPNSLETNLQTRVDNAVEEWKLWFEKSKNLNTGTQLMRASSPIPANC